MNKKRERLITAEMIAGLLAVFFYQVAYGVESGGYPIARYDKCDRIKTVRNTVEDVKFIFTRLTSSVDVVE